MLNLLQKLDILFFHYTCLDYEEFMLSYKME